jgi:phosphonate transport system substrate-binding protein
MVFTPSTDVTQTLQAAETLGDLLEAELGLPVHVYVADCYGSAIEAMAAQEADVGWLSAVPYVFASDLYGIEVKLTRVRFGQSYYRGQFLVRSDSGINDLSDLAGKNFAFPDQLSNSGYLYPAMHISKTQGTSAEDFFNEILFIGNQRNVVQAVYDGEFEGTPIHGGSTYEDARQSVLAEIPDVYTETKVIALTEKIPNATVSVRPGLDENIVQQVVDGLLDVASSQEGQDALSDLYGIEGLALAEESDYDIVREYVEFYGVEFESCSQSTLVTQDTGGSITFTNDQGRDTLLDIPPGVVERPTLVKVAQIPVLPSPPSDYNHTGDAFEINAILSDTVQNGGSQRDAEILTTYTLTIEYDGSGLSTSQESNLRLYNWQDGTWVKEASSRVDTMENVITAYPDHFSIWAVLGPEKFNIYLPYTLSGQ